MERTIFDTHAHYMSGAFNKDRAGLLDALPQKGVALVLDCGTDCASSKESIDLAQQYDWIYAAVGIHPTSLIEEDSSTTLRYGGDWKAELREIEKLLESPQVKAIGEIGLDHHWPVPKEAQYQLFEAQIRLAMEHQLPLSIHDREAHAEIYELLKRYKPKAAVLHSFSGSAEDAAWLCRQGVYLGFSGVVTFKNARRPLEVAAMVPEEYLLLETDCPYMAPEPMRGKRCDSSLIWHTAAKIAECRGTDTESILKLGLENGKRVFKLV